MLSGSYDYPWVALSVALSMCAAYAALDLAGRATVSRGWGRLNWLGGGATAMGVGIWATHYVAMLAFHLPVPVFYHYPTVIVSLFAAIAASAVALYTVSRERMSLAQEIAGSVVMASGIAAMHYIGMAAMRMPAMMEYRWDRVGLSLVLSFVISFVALALAFRIREEQHASRRKRFSALAMGSAIPLMHYTGMWAVTFRAHAMAVDLRHAVGISTLGVAVIVITSFLVLGSAMAASFLDRLLISQKVVILGAQQGEVYFRTMVQAIPEIVWTANPDGMDDFFNQKCLDYTGMSLEQIVGDSWTTVIHPDDLALCLAKWQDALRDGEAYEIEYRLRAKDGTYRWFLGRGNPVRDAQGKIVKWFGTCTDIEDQKQNQQILEEQIKERTEALADANTRLQEEMWERDLARKALDEQNERMMQSLTERSRRATQLAKMGELLQSCLSKEEAFAAALGFAPKIFPTTPGAVALLNSGRNLTEVIGSWADCQLPAKVFDPTDCWALRTGHAHLVVAGDRTAPCPHAAGVKHSYLCIPILAQGESLGILHVQATDETPQLSDSETSFKTTFAEQLGLSIANIRLRDALRAQSIKDPLTGLYNRRYLEEMLDREIRRAVRAEQALGILMLDLDHFKKFNDTYGHEAGDAVLREAGAFLTSSIRVEDFVCRFGGEEFVVILPTAGVEASHMRAERIRARIRELVVLHQGHSVGMITASIGVSALPVHGASPKKLLEAADAALYRAKREGRDRVVVADPPATAQMVSAAVGGSNT